MPYISGCRCTFFLGTQDPLKVSFVEYPYLPGVHTFFGPMQRLRAKKDSSSTGKGQGTPLYVAADGKILDDSWESLEVLGPVPEEMKKAK